MYRGIGISLHSAEDAASGAQSNMQLSSGIHLICSDTGAGTPADIHPFHLSDGAAEVLPLSDPAPDRGVALFGTAEGSRYKRLGSSVNPHFRVHFLRFVQEITDSPF